MNKKQFIILFFAVLLIVGGWYWWAEKQGVSMREAVRMMVGGERAFNVDDPAELFNVPVPEHFNDTQKERLGDKINLSTTLYDTKKDDTWTWITIGNMYEFAEDYDRAISAYEHAASLNPGEYISRINLGYIYENNKIDYKKAEEYYTEVLEINSANPDSYVNLARLYEFKMNNPEEAEKIYLRGLEKTNNYPDLLVMIIRFYQNQNNTAKVAEYSKLLLELHPDNEVYQRDFGEFVK